MERIIIGTDEPTEINKQLFKCLKKDIQFLVNYREFIYYQLSTKLKVRYQRSHLGILWTVLTPLLTLIILSIVFGHVIGRNIPNYPVYLFCGTIPFTFLQQVVIGGGRSLLENANSAKQINIPFFTYPLIFLGFQLINMLCALTGVFIILLIFGTKVYLPAILLPVYIIIFSLFCFGASLISMSLITYLRDFEHFLSVFFRGLYFLSPVLMFPDMLGKYKFIMTYNPLTYFLTLFRCGLYYNHWPNTLTWIVTVTTTVLIVSIGYGVYKKLEKNYVFQL